MKCQILFSGKNKKNIINLSSAENAQRVVKVKLFSKIRNCSSRNHIVTDRQREITLKELTEPSCSKHCYFTELVNDKLINCCS